MASMLTVLMLVVRLLCDSRYVLEQKDQRKTMALVVRWCCIVLSLSCGWFGIVRFVWTTRAECMCECLRLSRWAVLFCVRLCGSMYAADLRLFGSCPMGSEGIGSDRFGSVRSGCAFDFSPVWTPTTTKAAVLTTTRSSSKDVRPLFRVKKHAQKRSPKVRS